MTGRGSKSGRAAVGPLPWFMWSLGALFFCYGFFQRVAPSVLVSDLMRDFGVGAAVLGNLSAFYFYAYAGMQLPLGVLVDNWGPRRILTGGALVCGLGTLMFATADTLGPAYLGRFLIGAGAGFAFVATLKLAATWFQGPSPGPECPSPGPECPSPGPECPSSRGLRAFQPWRRILAARGDAFQASYALRTLTLVRRGGVCYDARPKPGTPTERADPTCRIRNRRTNCPPRIPAFPTGCPPTASRCPSTEASL